MADTTQHLPPDQSDVLDEFPEPPRDWKTIDRLIILMSLSITKRMLRRRSRSMPDRIRHLVMLRMDKLIAVYRRPR